MKNSVSLILLNYNNSIYLESCLSSIVPYKNNYTEIVFLDDCSVDESEDYYKSIIDKYPELNMKLYSNERNLGVVGSLMKAIPLLKGDFVQILATDDMFGSKNSLPDLNDRLTTYVSPCIFVDDIGAKIGNYPNIALEQSFLKGVIYYSNPVKAPGMLTSIELIKSALSNTQVEFEDWPILRETISSGGKVKVNLDVEVLYRQHGKGLSSKLNVKRLKWMNNQVSLFLKESLSMELSTYDRLMSVIQLKYLNSNKLCKYAFSAIRYIDLKRLFINLIVRK